MTKLVKRLEARALVRRRADADDKRSISLELTGTGKRHAQKLRALQATQDAFVFSALTSAERSQLMQYVARIIATLDFAERKAR